MSFEIEQPNNKADNDVEQKIRNYITEEIDPNFSGGEKKLFRDVLNFWFWGFYKIDEDEVSRWTAERLKEYFDSIKSIPYYQEGYVEKGKKDVENVRKGFGEKAAEFHKVYYPRRLERIMELSDPKQVIKYNKLVDKFNNDLDHIKRERDIDALQKYYQEARMIVDGEK